MLFGHTLCVLLALVWCRLARWILSRTARDILGRSPFFLSLNMYTWVVQESAFVERTRGPVSNGTQCSVRLSPCSPHPPIAPCAHLHGAEPLGGMQQHSRKESPGLPSSLVGCKCVPNLGRVRFFAVPCPARTRASPAPRNAFLLIHPCVRMVCNAFCAGAAMQGWVAGGSSGVGVCFMDSVFCPLLTPHCQASDKRRRSLDMCGLERSRWMARCGHW